METQLSEKEIKELEKKLKEKRVAIREFYFGISGSKIKNVKESKKLRKEIAQILTKLNSK